MKNALLTASSRPLDFEKVHLHLNDNNMNNRVTMAKNVLIANIILAKDFNPKNNEDLQYVLDVWFNAQWSEPTTQHFLKDVDHLLADQWPKNIILQYQDLLVLKDVWLPWKTVVSTMDSKTFDSIFEQRLVFK